MKNRRALFSAVSSLMLMALAVIACEDEKTSTFDENKEDGGGSDGGGGFVVDSGASNNDTRITCNPKVPTSFKPTFKSVTHQDVCSFEQIGAYYSACLQTDAAGNAKLQSADCTAWLEANAACGACIETADNSGPVQVHDERRYYTLNNAGCIAIKQNNGAPGSCAEAYDTSASCRREACKTCLSQEGANFDDFLACQAASIETGRDCASYQKTSVDTCGPTGYRDAGSSLSAVDCFGRSPEEAQGVVFQRVIGAYCQTGQ